VPAVPYEAAGRGPASILRSRLRARALRARSRHGGEPLDVDGFKLLLEPGVPRPASILGCCPESFLGKNLDVRPGERVLVLDSGCGLVALHAGRRGARVAAADARPQALQCLRRSFLLAGFGEPDVRQGSGFEAFSGERWDAVACVLGWEEGPPREAVALAETLRALAALLDRGGRLLLAAADRDVTPGLQEALTAAGLRWATVVLERWPVLGPARVYRAWRPGPGDTPGEQEAGEALPGAEWLLRDR
jgi:SAM-dependent methyltransferase